MADTPSTDSHPSPSSRERLEELLDIWEAACQRGERLSIDELCANEPELAPSLRRSIDRLKRFNAFDDVSEGLEDAVPEQIGPYRVLRELARGGTSAVYLCEQPLPKREVAVKLLQREVIAARRLRRFQLEVQLLATLSHPGIAQIHDAGTTDDGLPYFAMEYIRGHRLDDFVGESQLDVEAILKLFIEIADALHFAHQQGIIHRDLKPANILVTDEGRPKIIDFGIARLVLPDKPSAPTVSASRLLAGTAPYMSPEQFLEDRSRIDVRSDVYGLAIVLFEALSGDLPYDVHDKSLVETAQTIRSAPPRRLPRLDSRYDRSLNAVLQKALEKDPRDRYQTVAEFAKDLDRVLSQRPVLAKRAGPLRQLCMWARRNPKTATVSSAVAVLMTTCLLAGGWLLHVNTTQSRELRKAIVRTTDLANAVQQKNTALEASNSELLRTNRALQDAAMNATMMRASLYARTDPALAHSLVSDDDRCPLHLRGLPWRLLERETHRSVVRFVTNGSPLPEVLALEFSSDGRTLVTLTTQYARWWNADDGTLIHSLQERIGAHSRLAVDSAARRALVLREDGVVFVVDRETGEKMRLYDGAAGPATAVALSADGRFAAVGNRAGSIFAWKSDVREPQMTIDADDSPITVLGFSDAADRLGAVSQHAEISIVSVPDEQVVDRQKFPSGEVVWGEFSHDLDYVCAGPPGRYAVWNRRTETVVRTERGPRVASMLDDPRNGLLTATRSHVHWQTADGMSMLLHASSADAKRIAVSANGARVAVGCTDGAVSVYRIGPPEGVRSLKLFDGRTDEMVFAPDGALAAVSGEAQNSASEVTVLQVPGGRPTVHLRGFSSKLRELAFSHDGRTLFTSQDGGVIVCWDVATGERDREFASAGERVSSLAVSHDGARLFAGTVTGAILVYSAVDGRILDRLNHGQGKCRGLLLHDGGGMLISVGGGTVCNWKTATGELVWQANCDRFSIHGAAISPDQTLLAIGSARGSPSIWKVGRSGLTRIAILRSDSSRAMSLDFSRDGAVLVTGDATGHLVLWDTKSWQPQASLPHPHGAIRDVAFSPDGRVLAVGGEDGGITIWDLAVQARP